MKDASSKKENITLATVIAKDSPPEKRKTPIQSVMNQITWELSNKEKYRANCEAILWDVSFGTEGTVATKVPKTSQPWYNIALLKVKNNAWIIDGLMDFPVSCEETTSNNRGLAVPMTDFNTMTMTLSDRCVHAFADDKKVIVISKSPKPQLFDPTNGFKPVGSKKTNALIKSDPKQSTLYYFDSKYLIWISGNISQSEILNLTNSLPPVDSPDFPFKNR